MSRDLSYRHKERDERETSANSHSNSSWACATVAMMRHVFSMCCAGSGYYIYFWTGLVYLRNIHWPFVAFQRPCIATCSNVHLKWRGLQFQKLLLNLFSSPVHLSEKSITGDKEKSCLLWSSFINKHHEQLFLKMKMRIDLINNITCILDESLVLHSNLIVILAFDEPNSWA